VQDIRYLADDSYFYLYTNPTFHTTATSIKPNILRGLETTENQHLHLRSAVSERQFLLWITHAVSISCHFFIILFSDTAIVNIIYPSITGK
jgi:hypothetical protein